jgi:lipopolysaccharide/colanic/teichoic acid biosynthesis glycosyltransferase
MAAHLLFGGAQEPAPATGRDTGPPRGVVRPVRGSGPRWVVRLPRRAIVSLGVLAALLIALVGHTARLPWGPALALAVALSAILVGFTTASLGLPTGPVALDAGVRSPALGVVWPPRRRAIFVVGESAFCRNVTATALVARRRLAGQWVLPATAGPVPRIPSSHDVVVDSRRFADLRERLPEVFEGRNRIVVVPEGEVHVALLAGPLGPVARAFKRSLDITLALAALVLCAPCLLLAMLAIRLDTPGPALFRQVRVGAGGRRFTLYKLRTMTMGNEDPKVLAYMASMVRCQAEPENGMFKLGSNRRITRIGRILRRFSIDEVPQLLNVLKGEMSLVGPRPCILEEAACYNEFHWQRLAVRPGITGLAQVNGRSRLRFDDIVTLDVQYSRRWTPMMELKILLRTPLAVLSGRGAT